VSLGHSRCDYLGLKEDPRTCLGFPSNWNYCQHATPPESVRPDHQRLYCQTARYTGCPVFQSEKTRPLPAPLRGSRSPRVERKRWGLIAALIVILGVMTALLARGGWRAGDFPFNSVVNPTSTEATTPPAPGPSPMGQCGHQFEAPFGSNHQLIIHRVQNGDSLNMYADTYHTSVGAIQALNYHLPIPMWKDWSLVIPVGETQVSDLPPFEAYQVTDPGITLVALAEKLSVDLEALRRYNDFEQSCKQVSGWLLVPRENATP
jgi:hypothetical protein